MGCLSLGQSMPCDQQNCNMTEIVCFNCRYVTEKLIGNRSKSSHCSEKQLQQEKIASATIIEIFHSIMLRFGISSSAISLGWEVGPKRGWWMLWRTSEGFLHARYPYSTTVQYRSDIPCRLAHQNIQGLLPKIRGLLQLQYDFDVSQMLQWKCKLWNMIFF